MNRQTTKTVDEIGQLHIEGNIIPPQWFKAIRQGKRADTVAVILLGEVFYWYRPTVIRDEATGDVKEIRRKFDGDKWQCSYQSMADRFGFTKRQCQDAAKRLRDAGLITLELRNFIAPNGTHLSNVLFIEPVPAEIKRITFDLPSDVPTEGVFQSDVGGITPERKTYTETPTDKVLGESKNDSPATAEKTPPVEIPIVPGNTAPKEPGTSAADAEFDAMPSASEGMPPLGELNAAVADPWIAQKEYVKRLAPMLASVFDRKVITEDRQAARRAFELHLNPEFVARRVIAYRNGEGTDFRKPEATAFWVVSRLEKDMAMGIGAPHVIKVST